MKFKVSKTSDGYLEVPKEVEISTLEELKELYDEYIEETDEIIVNFKKGYIEIYDDYRE